jgi:hypothetical protein
MGGNVKCRQSVELPWHTIIALVKAAKVMVIAAKPTQIPVREAGELSSTERSFPVEGGRSRHLPPCDGGRDLCFGGSWTVVAIMKIDSSISDAESRAFYVPSSLG